MLLRIAVGFVLSLVFTCLWKWCLAPRAFGAQKLDHIKYDILPDGTLGPGDNQNLEEPE